MTNLQWRYESESFRRSQRLTYHTIWNHPSRFHLVEVSIPALEIVLEHLEQQKLDFLPEI